LLKTENKPLEQKFFFEWLLVITLAWTITSLALTYNSVRPLCLLPVLGLAQWFVLKYYLPKVQWWIWTNILGVVISTVVLIALVMGGLSQNIVTHPTFSGFMTGISVGILQWFFLRQWVAKAGWWILANTVGFTLGKIIIFIVGELTGPLMGAIVGGLVFAGITGFVLIWLLQSPLSER
jgi:hypothetical protein